jgi:hypothetical protein
VREKGTGDSLSVRGAIHTAGAKNGDVLGEKTNDQNGVENSESTRDLKERFSSTGE